MDKSNDTQTHTQRERGEGERGEEERGGENRDR